LYAIGTGASRMIEPLPLAVGDSSPDWRASAYAANFRNEAAVVTPISKALPFTPYSPVLDHER